MGACDYRTRLIVALVAPPTPSPQTTLSLYSILHQIVLSLARPDPPSANAIIAYFTDSLLPAFDALPDSSKAGASTTASTSDEPVSPRSTIEEGLFDVIWQLDQEIDNGLLAFLIASSDALARSSWTMSIDKNSKDLAAEHKAEEERKVQGRAALVTLLKGLNVSLSPTCR